MWHRLPEPVGGGVCLFHRPASWSAFPLTRPVMAWAWTLPLVFVAWGAAVPALSHSLVVPLSYLSLQSTGLFLSDPPSSAKRGAAIAFSLAASSALTSHLRARPSFRGSNRTSQQRRSGHRYAPRPACLPLRSTSRLPAGVRTIRISSRLGRWRRQAMQVRSGICFRDRRGGLFTLHPPPSCLSYRPRGCWGLRHPRSYCR